MTTPAITLVYDGDCPVCRNYTQHLSIKQAAGTFELQNARDNPPIVQEINALNLDMDEGFVLKIGDRFYHGADAIHTLALLSTGTGVFNKMNFWFSDQKPYRGFCIRYLKQAGQCCWHCSETAS